MHVYSSCGSRTSALGVTALLAVLLAIAANALTTKFGIGPAWLVSAPTVAAAYGLLYRGLDRLAWRWSVLHRLGLIETPIVEGVYEGQVVSSYRQATLPVRLRIDQTWTRIAIRFEVLRPTASSTSYSVAANLDRAGHDDARLTYTYRNQAQPGVAEVDMYDHDGTVEVTVDRTRGSITGRYFNFRGRQGTITLSRVQPSSAPIL